MPFTAEDLAIIDEAIASGVLQVRYADRTVTYQSMAALLAARKLIKADVDAAAGRPTRRRTMRVFQSGRGT